jgi:predicted SAM-dependent methyltransferase
MSNLNIITGATKDLKEIRRFYWIQKRRSVIRDYLKGGGLKKLHLGSNITVLDEWLCSDLKPKTAASIYLDATKKYPFDSGVFDYIYSEHMIEHVSQESGVYMLQECFRVLKIKGKIRIATPNLRSIVDIYAKREEDFGSDYVKWITDNFVKNSEGYNPTVVLNTMFRNWGHMFLYDFEMLKSTLEKVGFSNINRYAMNMSEDENLKDIERHHLNVDTFDMVEFETINVGNFDMVEFETIILEAEKP